MTRPSWIRNLTSHLASAGRKKSPRLLVEPLEDRCVPATITVNSILDNVSPPAGTVTLRSAIAQAETDTTPDTIGFAPALLGQTITLGGTALPTLTKGETITGLGRNSLTVNANNASRIFSVTSTTQVTISGLALTGGNAGVGNSGGAVVVTNGNLQLTNVALVNNAAPANGGAVDLTGAAPTFNATNCVFSSNTSGGEGGAVENEAGATATVTGCVVTSNTAGSGSNGAGVANRGQMTITGSAISLNNGPGAAFFGAGLFNAGSLALTNSSVIANTSQGAGGGLWTNGTLCNVFNSTIANNLALGSTGGGGIRVNGGPLALLNDTITNNTDASGAATNAGGVSFGGTTLTMSNTIVAQNFASGAGAPPDIRAAVAGGSVNNFIGIGDATLTGITTGTAGNQIGTTAVPLNPLLGALQDNGTPPPAAGAPTGAANLLTRKPLPSSPVINTGSNVAAAALTTDERGFLRVIGGIIDIGAVEFQTPLTTTTLTVAPASPTPTGVSVTLTATVAPAPTSTPPNNPVTGTVTFLNGTTILGIAPLDPTGKAMLVTNNTTGGVTVPPLPDGTDALTAQYNGDANYGPSTSNLVNQVVQDRKITPGTYDPTTGGWSLRFTNTAGNPDIPTFLYGAPGSGVFPVVGDWTGTGVFTVGIYTQATATFQIRLSNTAGAPDITFSFGPANVGIPVAGDWSGSGKWGIGVFDPTTGNWNLRNELSGGLPDAGSFLYGAPGSKPVVGDWNVDGKFTIGVVEPDGTWKLKNNNTTGPPDFTFQYGMTTDTPIAGDWDANGTWTPGVVTPTGGAPIWKLRNSNSAGAPDITPFAYGTATAIPIPGSWVFPGMPLQAAGGEGPGAATLDPQALPGIISAALGRLQAAGVDAETLALLSKVTVETRPLDSGELGEALPSLNLVYIDQTAAGHGWFVDPTPSQDEEFQGGQAVAGSAAAGRMDLLTVLLHEYGHIAGLGDGGSGLMAATLAAGTRVTDALDAVFGSK